MLYHYLYGSCSALYYFISNHLGLSLSFVFLKTLLGSILAPLTFANFHL